MIAICSSSDLKTVFTELIASHIVCACLPTNRHFENHLIDVDFYQFTLRFIAIDVNSLGFHCN